MSIITIHNVDTGEIEIREMNAKELAQREADEAEAKARAKREAEVIAQRQILLNRLGITEEEARVLLG